MLKNDITGRMTNMPKGALVILKGTGAVCS